MPLTVETTNHKKVETCFGWFSPSKKHLVCHKERVIFHVINVIFEEYSNAKYIVFKGNEKKTYEQGTKQLPVASNTFKIKMNALAILDDLCRLCLSETGVENIFHPVDLANNIFNITGVKVLESDVFPQNICKKCLNIVNDAQNLRIISQNNDSHLKLLMKGSTSCVEKEEKHDSEAVPHNTVVPSCSNVTKTSTKKETSDAESDVTVESLFKHRKKSYKSGSDRGGPFKCDKCNKTFTIRKKLSLHSRTHNKNFICPLDACGKTFAYKNDLKKHIRCHTGEKPYKCTQCDKSFTQNVTLRNHRMSVHCKFD